MASVRCCQWYSGSGTVPDADAPQRNVFPDALLVALKDGVARSRNEMPRITLPKDKERGLRYRGVSERMVGVRERATLWYWG